MEADGELDLNTHRRDTACTEEEMIKKENKSSQSSAARRKGRESTEGVERSAQALKDECQLRV